MNQILDLLLPTPCVLCSKPGNPFCSKCRSGFELDCAQVTKLGISGFSFCSYESDSALIVNAIKEMGQTSLIGPIASLMARLWPEGLSGPILVPIPSSPANYRRRGYQHTHKLASALEKRLPGSRVVPLLRSSRDRADQSALNPQERIANLNGAFSADLRGFQATNAPIVLIDDVITTGASIAAGVRALEDAGLGPISFCVFAETKPKIR
jgi:predicted amidophosphoribosyltransferase